MDLSSMDLSSIDHLLTTTRSVRKRLDLERPVELDVVRECIDLAIQAPDGGNLGKYHFLIITDADKRAGADFIIDSAHDIETTRGQIRAVLAELRAQDA